MISLNLVFSLINEALVKIKEDNACERAWYIGKCPIDL